MDDGAESEGGPVASRSVTRKRHPKSITRSTILDKAYEMYLDRELERGNEKLVAVLERLGYTTGAGYQIWANQAAFRDDLAVHIAESIEYASLRNLFASAVELASADLPFEEHALAAGDNFVAWFLGREEFYIKLRFYELPPDRPPAITAALRDAYERSAWEAGEIIAAGLERFGRRLRAPLTMTDLVTAVTAALEGYALRFRVQPERVAKPIEWVGGKHHPFSLAFLAIVKDYTEPIPQNGGGGPGHSG